jgi:glycosyl transferase family 25
MISNISDIKHTFYINLESRPDRKLHVEDQLNIIGIQATRFNAIKLPNGALGCSMSHLKCLEIARENNWEHVLIVEDDIKFLNPELFIRQLNKFFSLYSDWDVVLIAGNNLPPHEIIDDSCVKVTQCQTTTGYIVKNHYYNTLIDNIRNGITNLIKEPSQHYLYAIDKNWFKLQQKDKWYLITPLTVTQREDYSDIEKRPTNYTRAMTDLTKEWLTQKQQNIRMNYTQQKPPISLSKINFST